MNFQKQSKQSRILKSNQERSKTLKNNKIQIKAIKTQKIITIPPLFYKIPLDHTSNLRDCYETFQRLQKNQKTIKNFQRQSKQSTILKRNQERSKTLKNNKIQIKAIKTQKILIIPPLFYKIPLDHTPNLPDCYETFQSTQKFLKTIKIKKN